MRNVNPDEILKRSDYQDLTDKQFKDKVCEHCRYKLQDLDNIPESEKILQLNKFPEKVYEIFNLNVDGGKIFVLKTNEIYYIGDEKEKELYYSPNVVKELCIKMKQLNESAINLIDDFADDIKRAKEDIETLKELDNQEYGLARFMYSTLGESNIIDEYGKLNDENKALKENLEKSQKNVEELSNKLKFLLDEMEKNKKSLDMKSKNIFQRIAEKLTGILN